MLRELYPKRRITTSFLTPVCREKYYDDLKESLLLDYDGVGASGVDAMQQLTLTTEVVTGNELTTIMHVTS